MFTIGEIVRMNCGGPNMTVVVEPGGVLDRTTSVGKDKVKCRWFNSDNELQEAVFPIAVLRLAFANKFNSPRMNT